MNKYILNGLVLLFSTTLSAASSDSIPIEDSLSESLLYQHCEELSVENYPLSLMDMDLNFDDVFSSLIYTEDRKNPDYEKKIACLKQKRQEVYTFAWQQVEKNNKEGKLVMDDYFTYLLKKKDPKAKAMLLNYFKQKTASAIEQEQLIDYLLYYQTFYIKDNDGYVNLREKPSAISNSVKKLTNGTQITLINYHNNWWYVMLDNNQTGYIYVDRITDK